MINPFVVKKWAALLMVGLITTVLFFMGLTFYNFLFSFVFMGAGLIVSALVANKLLDNPFRQMLEGQGVLALNIDSTGVIRPFIMAVRSPYVEGKLKNKLVSDVFDRATVLNLAAPQTSGIVQQGKNKEGKDRLVLVLDEEEYNKGRFALFHFPVIIYNEQIQSIVTKDFLADREKSAFAEHTVLYLNRKMEELTSAIRDFGRHVVENLKPKGFPISSGMIIIIVIIFIIILLIIFAPSLLPAVQKAAGSVTGAAGNAAGAVQTVT
jgi:hypothetical protein